jgi:glutaminyl-tRNA synthetase
VSTPEQPDETPSNFIREMIAADVQSGKWGGRVHTRFPPEPNGYLHIGHAKAICIDFGMAAEFGGFCNLRFDDTNPTAEEVEYVEAIERDVRWLGFDWGEREYFASDYFERMYECAVDLIKQGKAYVDSQSVEAIREKRGNFHKPGEDSPYRNRSVEENLDLFARMRAGEFEEGAHVLRAKIDMQHKNLNMRDPLLYRILKQHHHRTGDAWCIYPMYDYAHPLEDAFEDITHSLCSLEFQDHRPLYDWVVDNCPVGSARPEQTEFARLNLDYTLMSKRKLLQLVNEKHVDGWDDPRMPTLSGLRRRGIPPEAIVSFCERVGVSKRDGIVDISLFEHVVRERLNEVAPFGAAITYRFYPRKLDRMYPQREKPELSRRVSDFAGDLATRAPTRRDSRASTRARRRIWSSSRAAAAGPAWRDAVDSAPRPARSRAPRLSRSQK